VRHRCGVDSAHREIQVDSTEDVQTRNFLANDVRESAGWIVMVLENNSTHSFGSRKLRDVEGIYRSRAAIGIAVDMDVDGACEYGIRLTCVVALTGTGCEHKREKYPSIHELKLLRDCFAGYHTPL